jgi:hypothetical protein
MSDIKSVHIERHKWTKAERQYIQSIVHNYSLQRWTDQEIVDYLWDEKKIRMGRTKYQVEENAGAWYVGIKRVRLQEYCFLQRAITFPSILSKEVE